MTAVGAVTELRSCCSSRMATVEGTNGGWVTRFSCRSCSIVANGQIERKRQGLLSVMEYLWARVEGTE